MNIEFIRSLLPEEVIVYLMIFFGALLIFEGFRQVISGSANEIQHKNRRMRMIADGVGEKKITEALIRNNAFGNTRNKGPVAEFQRALAHANVPFGFGAVMLILTALAVVIFIFSSRWLPLPFAALATLVLSYLLPYAILNRLAEARLDKLTEQLPDALDLMARGLRVGHPLNVTLRRVARDMPDPIGSEFGIIEDRIRHGIDLPTAFREFADRIDREDVHYLSVCVGIQHGSGGNLGRVLLVLSRVIRDRRLMKKKIHAISSEGRLSGLILTMMPFLIIGVVHTSTPSFFGDVMDHPIFMPVVIVIMVMIVLQGFILKLLTDFDF
ncbi:tight adherence protein B [Jannaschia faecimaris]|uniref:Tight adherence protein B n=1 Tax=Jannaschia faecimaris TaxID=1244108 RepID=A0A1H3TKR1_9RHOB|nr:type II secretion system F family protein [Jannaschia faecimaris]SDZ50854.1 tight adherence protein B [Jannaschia faecimaris]